MLLNAPAGITAVIDNSGNSIPVVNGQVDVEPHLVAGLEAQGFTLAAADAVSTDAPEPGVDTTVPQE